MPDYRTVSIGATLERLRGSAFRARFHLGQQEREYAMKRGEETIRRHAEDFVRQRLAPANVLNDGRQTPLHGHPVFVAQHACACCCRGCLAKWHGIPKGCELSPGQQAFVVSLLMAWIIKEMGMPAQPERPTRKSTCPQSTQLSLLDTGAEKRFSKSRS